MGWRKILLAILVVWKAEAQSQPQEAPRSLSGSLTAGWLDSVSRETFEEQRKNPFTTLKLDYQSYLLDPEFLTYRVQPRFSTGFQDAFIGLSDGSGVAFETAFLPKRPFPLRFRYARFRRSLLTSGLAASYAKYISRNDDSVIGLQWQLDVHNLPKFEIAWNKIATATAPEAVLAEGFETHSNLLTLSVRDTRMGWVLMGSESIQKLDTAYLLGREGGPAYGRNRTRINSAVVTAQRRLWERTNLFASANRSASGASFEHGDFNQMFDAATAKLDYHSGTKMSAWAQGRNTRTSVDAEVVGIADQILPYPKTMAENRIVDGEVRYRLWPALTLMGRAEVTWVLATGTAFAQRPGTFRNVGGGAQYFRTRRTVTTGLSYYLYRTFTDFAFAPTASLTGHAVEGSLGFGNPAFLRTTVGGAFTRSNELMRGLLPFRSSAERLNGTLARRVVRGWTLEVQGALLHTAYDRQELRANFKGQDYGASVSSAHGLFSFFRSVGWGSSLQALWRPDQPLPAGTGLLYGLGVGSSTSATTMSAAWTVNSALTARAVWRSQRQVLGNVFASSYEQREAIVQYQYRKLRFEGGYQMYSYNFGTPIIRRSILFRMTRDFQIF